MSQVLPGSGAKFKPCCSSLLLNSTDFPWRHDAMLTLHLGALLRSYRCVCLSQSNTVTNTLQYSLTLYKGQVKYIWDLIYFIVYYS